MNPVVRILLSLTILGIMIYSLSNSLSEMGNGMAAKSIKNGNDSQVRYHQGTVKDTPECSGFKASMGAIDTTSTDGVGKKLLALSEEARSNGCLK